MGYTGVHVCVCVYAKCKNVLTAHTESQREA